MKKILLRLIRLYQIFFKFYTCRFIPTCSEYSYQAIEKYGILHGLLKSLWRIIRCNPFSRGGLDPLL